MRDELGWESVYAYNQETFGPGGTLGRASDRQVVLTRYLRAKLEELNPGLPDDAYRNAIRKIAEETTTQSLLTTNRDKYALLRDGVLVSYRDERGRSVKRTLRVFDFEEPANNHFLVVRELWVRGDLYRRRADIVGFVNGIPLLFMELKNVHRDLKAAYEGNLADYKDTIPHLFHHNAIIVLANGIEAKIGSVSSRFEHFHEWKRLDEAEPGVVDMETLLKGTCSKANFMDVFENFIVFDEPAGGPVKVIARNHQFLGVNRAVEAVRDRKGRGGRLGVFWHTQGSGKSYSMVFFTRKVHRKLGGNFTFLICTDRADLDGQIYKTFAGCGVVNNDVDPCRAASGEDLQRLFGQHKAFIFALIQKFNREVDPERPYSSRDDIIVITDEAHRTQYGSLALNMRAALPNASYIGFTGTPLFKDDQITRRVFGEYVSTYDFKRAVDDGATVPLFYDARGDKLGVAIGDLNERIAERLELFEAENVDVEQRLEQELKRDYHVLTAEKRLDQVARDLAEHYSTAWETGKAMLICIDKITCVRMHALIGRYWAERIEGLERSAAVCANEQEEAQLRRQIQWMRETRIAVVVSEEQGEVEKLRRWGLDITPHRRLIKEGFETADGERIDVESAFKKADHPFRIAIVCAMWLTGFDVPSLANLYLDKPLKAHTLMQAIARANRVHEGKNNGLIVDYCGVLKNLRKALATFAGVGDRGRDGKDGERDPVRPREELLAQLEEAIGLVRGFLAQRGGSLDAVMTSSGFERNAAILAAKEAANENGETRKRFEILCREVFKKLRACLTLPEVQRFRAEHDAINIIYKSLQADRQKADISGILRDLQGIVDEAIYPSRDRDQRAREPFDISTIDFERLRRELERSPRRNTTVQNLMHALEARLRRMLQQNPLRTDFQKHYEEIVAEYNREKDRQTIEATFEALIELANELTAEESRAVREGLDEETLAIFDLLKKPDLSPEDIRRIKKVAVELLEKLKAEKLRIQHWRDREATRDAVRTEILNFLYSDTTGLPVGSYTEEDVTEKSAEVFRHVFRAYPTIPSPFYGEAA